MMQRMNLCVGDVVVMKKSHPCGSSRWKLLRVGADVRMQCLGCGHLVMLGRSAVEKGVREVLKEDQG
ncbi:MAG: DUF951 domain-containing protein [Blautia sp.]|nr:DUF951 domain-containing protein [Blautia sp.]